MGPVVGFLWPVTPAVLLSDVTCGLTEADPGRAVLGLRHWLVSERVDEARLASSAGTTDHDSRP